MSPVDNQAQIAIKAEGVSLRYRDCTVLKGIDLSVPEGSVVGLVGRNGAGKSSLLHCLVGLTAPDEGRCALLGSPSLKMPDPVRGRLGYVAQTPDLFDGLDGEAHFKRLGELYPRWDSKYAVELAARLDLPLGRRASNLSQGDQQKLSVVLALAHDPDVLILDEPVASLDPLARRDFMRVIFERREADAPRTVLVSSHLLNDLERVVTHVAFLRDGYLQLFDEWDALAEHVRLAVLPLGATDEAQGLGVLHRREVQGQVRLVLDTRVISDGLVDTRPLNLGDLFEELNT